MGLIQECQQTDAERRREVKQLRDKVATTLRDLRAQVQERQAEVAAIAQEATAIVEAADTFVKDLTKGSVQRRSEVAAILKEADNFVEDLARGSAQRRSEVAVIHEMVWGKAPTRKKTAPVVKDLPREAVIETAPAGELRDKVFTYLANHPDGTRLTELEEAFGVARIQTARVVRELMDNNKVEKRDLLYFTI